MNTRRYASSAVFMAVVVLVSLQSLAQGPGELSAASQPPDAQASAPAPQRVSDAADDAWHFNVAPYVFIPGIHGTVGVFGHDASVHVTGSDVLSDFNGGLAGYFMARKNRFVLPVDFFWARVATTKGFPLNELGQNSLRALVSEVIFTPKAGYRVWDGEHFKFDVVGGVRYWHEGLKLTPRPANITRSDSANWVDAVGGTDFYVPFNSKVWLTISGDVGAGQSTLDYQGLGLVNFQPKPLLGFFVGWRYVYVNYENLITLFTFNVAQSGPMFGLNFQFGGKPPVPPSASCSASPTEVLAGEPVTATINTQNFNPKHTLTYAWSSSGAKVSGTTGNVDTTGLAPGTYTVTGTATDAKEKKNNVASCNASFVVKQPIPPSVSCSATPTTIAIGDVSNLTMTGSDPQGWPLTYKWSASGGQLSGTGASATLTGTNADAGNTITVTGTATDDHGLSGTCTASVNVLSPPVTVNEVSEIGECKFTDAKRPTRVDNVCKAVLDDVALRIQREPNGKFLIVGYTDEQEEVTASELGAQRSVNMKYYLVNGEGGTQIDATRIDVRTGGTVKEKGAKVYFVPSGATFKEETIAVDETKVKGQSRKAPARRAR